MKSLFIAAALVGSSGLANAVELTAADREALLEKLDKLKEAADLKVDARYRAAAAAFRAAMASPDAAVDFYVKCVEKLNFTEQNKKESEFREWKKKEADKLKNPAFGRALCHQLRWLLLTLRAGSEKSNRSDLIGEAREAMEAVFRDAPALTGQHQLLSQGVMGTVFVKTFEIGDLRAGEWVNSPVQIGEIFDKLLMPPLRKPESIEALRNAWLRRIQLEGIAVDWKDGEGNNTAFGKPALSQEKEKFSTETLPDLQWAMEKDLFKSGDERGACVRMMGLIENHPTHKSAGKWSDELRSLISQPQEQPAEAPGHGE